MLQGARLKSRAGLAGLAGVAAAVLALGACGNPIARITTERAVSNSVGAVLSQPGISLRISLGATAQQLMQIDAATSHTKTLTPKMADAIASMSIVVDFATGHGESLKSAQVRTDHANQLDFALQIGSAAPVEIRYLNQTIYVRADATTLLTDFGVAASKAASFQNALQKGDAFLPGLGALGQGQWVSLQTSALAPLLGGLKSKLPATTPGANPTASRQLLDQLRTDFKSNATYTNAGTHNGRTEYLVTLAAHNFVQQVTSALPASISSIPGASSVTKGLSGLASKVPPNQTVVMQLWVSNNKAQEIDVDLNQFKHSLPFAVPLRVMIASATPVTAPGGATALDLSKIGSLLGGLLGGTSTPAG